jgi:hypothetical protein
MRILIALPIALFTLAIHAQDAGQMAAQQAMQAAQQASMQAQQANMQAQQDAQQASQQASIAAQASQANAYYQVAKPRFSVAGGSYGAPITLRLKDRSRGTVIYYTTDGWTPTSLSMRYTGPITLTSSTTVQAIAIAGGNQRSMVAAATYSIAGTQPTPISATFPGNAPGSPILIPGSQLPLVFTAPVSSHGMQVGDKLPIGLAQDLIVGGKLLAAKSTPVFATVTQVDPSGRQGLPGTITFEVHSLPLSNGATLFLSGTETREGVSHVTKAMVAFAIPLGGLLVRGQEAEIQAGTPLVARVEADSTSQAKLSADNTVPVSQP